MLDKPLSVIVISLYCFFSGLFFMFLASEGLYHHMSVFSTKDFGLWLTVVAPVFFMILSVILGIGILRLSNACWSILFYTLLTSISTFFSMVVASFFLTFISKFLSFHFFSIFNVPFINWKVCLIYFSSQTIVLYFLTREEIRAYFGE